MTGQTVDEVLVPKGCRSKKPTLRLLNAHNNRDVLAVLGTADQIRTSETEVTANLTFSSAPDVEPIFIRVAEGHVNEVSIRASYLEKDFTEIAPGKSRSIGGVTYTAEDVTKRIVRKWDSEEVSVVPFGADEKATIREKNELKNATLKNNGNNSSQLSRNQIHNTFGDENTMRLNSQAMRLLVRRGMSNKANAVAMKAFINGLSTEDRQRLLQRDANASLFINEQSTEATRQFSANLRDGQDEEASDDHNTTGPSSSTRSADRSSDKGNETGDKRTEKTTTRSESEIRTEERNRIKSIRELATKDTPDALIQKACDEGLTAEQAGLMFYNALRERSKQHVPSHNAGRTGIHVKRGATMEALQGAMLLKGKHKLDDSLFAKESAQNALKEDARWLCRAANALDNDQQIDDRSAAAMEDSHKYSQRSEIDILRFALRAAGKKVPSSNREVLRAAMSSGVLPRVFGPVINATMLASYELVADPTEGLVQRKDVKDFRPTEMIQIESGNTLDLLVHGVEAGDLELVESGESMRIYPFGKRFVIDEDIDLQDQMDVISKVPEQFGKLAKLLAPDLFFATLLANPNMKDGAAFFNTGGTRFNALTGTAFSPDQLAAMEALMAQQTIADSTGSRRSLNLMAKYLLVGRNKRYYAKQITGSATVTSANGNLNPYAGEYEVRSDARIANGVTNPLTKAFVPGSAKKQFLFAEGGQQGLVIGQLAGTGGVPQIRSMPLQIPGRWGYAWDIKTYVGIGFADFRGVVQNTEP